MSGGAQTALLVATVCCAAANAFEVVAKLVRADFVVQNSSEVGVTPRWLPRLALLEGAGAAGVTAGLFGPARLGLAASLGLVLFFVGALGAHVRARVFHHLAFPAVFLLLAAASAGYFA